MTDLPALLARVEAATGGDRGLDREILEAVGGAVDGQYWRWPGEENSSSFGVTPPFTTSLDATVALVEKLRPKWDILSGQNWAHFHSTDPARRAYFCNMSPRFKADGSLNDEDTLNVVGHGHTEVLARLAALLRSIIEEEGK